MSSLLPGLTGFSSGYLISWMVTNLKVPSLFGRQKSQCSIEDDAADTRAKALECLKGVDSLSWLPRISILRQSLKAEIHITYTWLNWDACPL